jgi:threonine dehydratase
MQFVTSRAKFNAMPNSSVPTAATLIEAHEAIEDYIHRTPVLTSSAIDEIAGCSLFFKCENFQKIGAFKMRGAAYAISTLTDDEKAKGVTTHSSGNHAQAIALAAKLNGIKAYIVMPENSPAVKRAAVLGYGAEVIPSGNTIVERETKSAEVIAKTGATFISPYNDYRIIAGQGTAAKELIEDIKELDTIIAPVGGGGLISGTALAVFYFSPETEVIAGEPELANDAYLSVQTGEIQPAKPPKTIADGLRTSIGDKNFGIIKEYVDEIILVTEDEIVAAMRMMWERMKIVIEPSSAVPLAVVLKNKERFAGERVGIIVTGGNVDLAKLPFSL